MARLLVVDDEEAMRKLVRLNLGENYEIVDTGEPEHALALALEHKPDAILLDLRMPRYSGFELCQTFTSFSSTQLIPVFVISGEAGSKTKNLCRDLGVAAYFEKPVNFDDLRARIEEFLTTRRKERRHEVRVRLRVPLKLQGTTLKGRRVSAMTLTENLSLSSFLCACVEDLAVDSVLDVILLGTREEAAGRARIIRSECTDTQYRRYASRFVEKTGNWVLQ